MNQRKSRRKSWKHWISLAAAFCVAICALPATVRAEDTAPESYVVLGDSISSGYGLASGEKSFAQLVGETNSFAVTNLAQAGYTSEDLKNQISNPAAVAAVMGADVITISAGGNDLMGALYSYLTAVYQEQNPGVSMDVGTMQNLLLQGDLNILKFAASNIEEFFTSSQTLQALQTCGTNLGIVIKGIQTVNPQAKVIVLNQYNPYAYLAAHMNVPIPDVQNIFQTLNQTFEVGVQKLNGALKLVAAQTGCLIADAYGAIGGASQNPCNASVSFSMQTMQAKINLDFHPNAYGHQLIADAVNKLLVYRASVAPESLDFGALTEGYEGVESQNITVKNTGRDTLSNVQVTLNGENSDSFVLDTTGLAASLAAGETGTVSVTPVPGLQEGTYTAMVVVQADQLTDKISRTVSVTVTAPTYTLTVENGTGGGQYKEGEVVTITANAAETGYHFAGWTTEEASLAEAAATTTTITMPAGNVTVTAGFEAHIPADDDGDCTTEVLCTVCGAVITPAQEAHVLKHYEGQAPTCTESGWEAYDACENCDYSTRKELPCTGHGATELKNKKEATCTQEGYTGDQVCTVCGAVVEEGKTIAKLAHNYQNGKCTVCGAKDPDYVVAETVSPNTGDNSPVLIWIAVLAVAFVGILGTLGYKRLNR